MQIYSKKNLAFGCGNILFGDDGFGPAVANLLNTEYSLPDHTLVLDVGTSIRDLLFDLLLVERKPAVIWIIDAVTIEGKSDGDLFELDLRQMPPKKMSDFSLHLCPSSNLLVQLKEAGVQIRVLCLQVPKISNRINPGLSEWARRKVPNACDWIIKQLGVESYRIEKRRQAVK